MPVNGNRLTAAVFFLACAVVGMAPAAMAETSEDCKAACPAPDEDQLGKSLGYPVGNPQNFFNNDSFRVGSFSNLDKIFPVKVLKKAPNASKLDTAPIDPAFRYSHGGRELSIDDYLKRHRVTGLLVIKDGKIALERYQYARKDSDKFLSNSMAKSIVSLAVGIALTEGKIRSLDDKLAAYVPELKGYAYGDTTIRNILRMASGIRYVEDYSQPGWGDMFKFIGIMNQQGPIKALQAFNERATPQGERFYYSSLDTQALGQLIRSATGQGMADYLSSRLWQAMGAESEANWVVGPDGNEHTYGNFSATLRDYGRLGWLLANDGKLDGKQIVSADYLLEATNQLAQPGAFAPFTATPYFGYGYQFWTFPEWRRRFALLGKYGQKIFVDVDSKLVLVHTAVSNHDVAANDPMAAEAISLWEGISRHYRGY